MPELPESEIFSPQIDSKLIPQVIALNRLNKNIYYYEYAHLERFLRESKKNGYCSIEQFQGLSGEIFENNVYENILQWAREDQDVVWFALKGAYVKEHFNRNGLSFSSKRQLVFNVDGLDFAEFDALFVRHGRIYFVEMTNSVKPNVAKRYKKRIYQKTQLLKRLFPQYEPICLVVLNNTMKDQTNWPYNAMFWFVSELKISDKVLERMATKKQLKFKSFSKNIPQRKFPRFDYYTSMRQATKMLHGHYYDREEFSEKMRDLFGLHSKFYYGMVNRKTMMTIDVAWPHIPDGVNAFYVAMKMEPFTYPILTFYYYDKKKKLYGIKLDKFKKEPVHEEVMKRKRTAIDLRKMGKELKEMHLDSSFLHYLDEEINGQLCMLTV